MVFWFAFCGGVSVLVVLCSFFFVFLYLSKKIPKKPDTAKNPKNKIAEKKDKQKIQLAQLYSQIVFLIFWGVGYKNVMFC